MRGLPTVKDLMDETFVTLKPDMQVSEAIDILLKNRITGAAVVDDDGGLVGVLSEKDCLRTLLQGAYDGLPAGLVSDYMATLVMTVPPDLDIFKLTEIFLKQVYRRLLVEENGKLVGQVTRRDFLQAIQRYIPSA